VNPRRVVSLAPALMTAAALMLWPVKASAQWHGGHGHVSFGVGIGVGYGHPFYAAPYFYNPFYWGYGGFYGGFYGYPYFAAPFYGPYPAYGYWDASADLRVQVAPRNAEVYVDGYLVGVVDDFDGTFQRVHMPLGEHEVSVYLPGYRTISQRMLFRPWESYKIKETMQALPAGETEPRPTPAPRSQSQAQPPHGMAPMYPGDRSQAYPGDRSQMYPGDRSQGNNVQVQPGSDRFGAVAVRVQPMDAEVLIDGERWEASNGERVLVQLTDGVHRVEVRKAGYRTYTSTVRVRSGETVTLNVSLSQE
jgi:PEGA domain-containing protein